jgi:hypothetical protein
MAGYTLAGCLRLMIQVSLKSRVYVGSGRKSID